MAALPKTDDTWREHYRTARDWALRHQQYTNCIIEPTGIGFNHRLRGPLGKRPSEKVMCFYYSKPKVTVGGKILIGFGRTYDDGEGIGQAFAVVSDCYSPNYSATDVRHFNDGTIVALVPIDQFGLVDIPSQNEFAVREAQRKAKAEEIKHSVNQPTCLGTTTSAQPAPTAEEIAKAELMIKSAADWEAYKQKNRLDKIPTPDVPSWNEYYAKEVKKANAILDRVPKNTATVTKVLEMEPKLRAAIIQAMLGPTAATAPPNPSPPVKPEKAKVSLTEVCNYSTIEVCSLLAKYGSVYGKPGYGARLLKNGTYSLYSRMTLYVQEPRDWQFAFRWLAKTLDYVCPTYHSILTIDRKSNTFELHYVPEHLQSLQVDVRKDIVETFKIDDVKLRHTRPRNYFEESIA